MRLAFADMVRSAGRGQQTASAGAAGQTGRANCVYGRLTTLGAKDDPQDAGLLSDILLHHRDQLRRLHPDTRKHGRCRLVLEKRRRLVHGKMPYSNQLTAHLEIYCPQMLGCFDEIGSSIAADFLVRRLLIEKKVRRDV